jgi:glycosyltransferase involved in cell wall biosynthesis
VYNEPTFINRYDLKIILFANTSWYLFNYCFPLANAIRQTGCEILLVSPEGDYTERLKAAGFRHLSFPMKRRSINPITEWRTYNQLVRLYRQEQPDIVHHFTTKCMIYGSLAAHAVGIQKVVNSVTGMGYAFSGDQLSRRFLREIIQQLYRRALVGTSVLFQNPNDRKEFINGNLVSPEQTTLIRSSGVDIEKFKPSPELDEPPLVVLAGRMLYDKGIVEFIQAAELLRSQNLNARFVLVGEPDPENPTSIPRKKIKMWENEGTIEWWGWQEDMAQVYRQTHIVCLPSTYREGVPKTLIEAAASGRPIITTDTPGCREVVQHGQNGLLVPMHSIGELANAIQILVEDKNMRQKMGLEGRRVAEGDFKLQNVLAAILAVYDINK